jgi:hypothetical protein
MNPRSITSTKTPPATSSNSDIPRTCLVCGNPATRAYAFHKAGHAFTCSRTCEESYAAKKARLMPDSYLLD